MQHRLPILVAAVTMLTAPAAAQDTSSAMPAECLDTWQALEAANAYATYCARCHKADALARAWFGSSAPADPDKTMKLALFLDRHSGCLHAQHELIARWLAERTGTGQ